MCILADPKLDHKVHELTLVENAVNKIFPSYEHKYHSLIEIIVHCVHCIQFGTHGIKACREYDKWPLHLKREKQPKTLSNYVFLTELRVIA